MHLELAFTYFLEQIVGRLRKGQPPGIPVSIYHQTIYALLDLDRHTGGEWCQYLRRRGKCRRCYGSKRVRHWPDDRVGIDARPLPPSWSTATGLVIGKVIRLKGAKPEAACSPSISNSNQALSVSSNSLINGQPLHGGYDSCAPRFPYVLTSDDDRR